MLSPYNRKADYLHDITVFEETLKVHNDKLVWLLKGKHYMNTDTVDAEWPSYSNPITGLIGLEGSIKTRGK